MLTHANLLACQATTPTSTTSAGATASCTPRPCRTAPGSTAWPTSPRRRCTSRARDRRLRSAEVFDARWNATATSACCRRDHGRRPGRSCRSPAATRGDGLKTIIYGGGPMYVADLKRALALFGRKLYQLYGQGESPMTITGLDKRARRRRGPSAPRGARWAAPAWRAPASPSRSSERTAGSCRAGEIGEIVTRSDCVMQGYWNNPDANARGPPRRLAVDRRPRRAGRRRLPHPQGPLQGHDHLRRLQHLPARDRGGAARPSRRAGGRRRRPAARRLGRGGRRLRGEARGRRRSGRHARPLCPRQHRPLQAPEGATASSTRCPRTTTARS